MKLGMFSIYDTKSQVYNPPFYQKNAGEASRSFSKICQDPQTLINQFPEDFVLQQIGEFDDESGIVISHQPIVIGTASQHINVQKAVNEITQNPSLATELKTPNIVIKGPFGKKKKKK